MKQITFIIASLFILFEAFAQNEGLILSYHGLGPDYMIDELIKNSSISPENVQQVKLYYQQHESELLEAYNLYRFQKQEAIREKNAENGARLLAQLLSTVNEVVNVAIVTQNKVTLEKQQKQAIEDERRANALQHIQEQHERAIAREATEQYERDQKLAQAQPLEQSKNTRRAMETSNLDSYTAVQMNDNIYGAEATDEALEQARRNAEASRQLAAQQTKNGIGEMREKVVSGATVSNSFISLKITSTEVVAWSTENDAFNNPIWNIVLPSAGINDASSPVYIQYEVSKRFNSTANINGVGPVFFNK